MYFDTFQTRLYCVSSEVVLKLIKCPDWQVTLKLGEVMRPLADRHPHISLGAFCDDLPSVLPTAVYLSATLGLSPLLSCLLLVRSNCTRAVSQHANNSTDKISYLCLVIQYVSECLIGNLICSQLLQPGVCILQQVHHHRTAWKILKTWNTTDTGVYYRETLKITAVRISVFSSI